LKQSENPDTSGKNSRKTRRCRVTGQKDFLKKYVRWVEVRNPLKYCINKG
jgi:hypothetical protein